MGHKAGFKVLSFNSSSPGDTDLPKVFVEETYMGGYNDLKSAVLSGQFKYIARDR